MIASTRQERRCIIGYTTAKEAEVIEILYQGYFFTTDKKGVTHQHTYITRYHLDDIGVMMINDVDLTWFITTDGDVVRVPEARSKA
ncbi:MAG: hypothetical protein DRH49_06880 [Candidatus Coatesbacteria bacterium]|nr:MAG: hypothetical protein DRH49_06880 [Candidatus Coatesbacteria bacterium]